MMFLYKCLYTLLLSSLVSADSLADFFLLLSPEKMEILDTHKIELDAFRNFTLLGSENVYAKNGELVEIRTVELHWPQYELLLEDNLKNLSAFYDSNSNIDYREYDDSGELTEHFFASGNVKFRITDGTKLLEKSITLESVDLVEQAIKQLQITDGKLSVLKYDENGHFIRDGSNIIPEYLASVESEEGETGQTLLEEIVKGFANIHVEENGDEQVIPGKLVQYLEERFSRRAFYVFSGEPSSWYLADKGFFKVSVRWRDVCEMEIIYTVFSHRKY